MTADMQFGGYDQGNGTNGLYQGQIGADFANIFSGTLSLDGVVSYAKDAVNTGTFTGSCAVLKSGPLIGQTACTSGIPNFYSNTDLTATLSNNTGVLLSAKYKWQAFTFFGGYEYIKQADPSGVYPNGFKTIGGWSVPGTIPSTTANANKYWPTQWITYNAYQNNRIANVVWTGVKYAINPQLDVTAAYYYLGQNNYNTTACTGTGIHTSSGKCAGSTDFISFLIDYRPVKRLDLYAGVMISNVYGGLASGYQQVQDISPMAGLRVKF